LTFFHLDKSLFSEKNQKEIIIWLLEIVIKLGFNTGEVYQRLILGLNSETSLD